ncbi:MAG: hypothetical protein ACLFUH_00370 [Bacteroidales bacterium]
MNILRGLALIAFKAFVLTGIVGTAMNEKYLYVFILFFVYLLVSLFSKPRSKTDKLLMYLINKNKEK